MTDLPGTETTAQWASNAFRITFIKIATGALRCIAVLTRCFIRTLILIPRALGRAFEMAYVDPYSGRDRDRYR